MHSFIKKILRTYYVPGSLPGTRDTVVSYIQDTYSNEAYIPILIQSKSKAKVIVYVRGLDYVYSPSLL